jgi:hypothetical protein
MITSPLLHLVHQRLIPHTDQIGAQLLDRVRGLTGLYRLGVVCDEEGLFGFDDDDAFSALL